MAYVSANPIQLTALRRAVRPVYAWLERNPQTRSFIGDIEAMKRRSSPEQASRCSAPLAPQKTATVLDGTWEMTASRAVAGEIDAGRYRMVLRRGQVSLTHVSPPMWRGAQSVFGVRGDRIVFRSPDGETGAYRWNVFRDTLTLSFVPGREEGAPNPTFAPWHRVGM
jgi:hypothetical protein